MGSTTTTIIEGSHPPLSLLFSHFFLLVIGITIHEAHQQEAIMTITKAWSSRWVSKYKQKEKNTKARVVTPIVVDTLLLKQP